MERQAIQIGPPDAGQGDDWYTAFTKVEANFSALFSSPLMGDVAAAPDPGSSASGNELVPASWVLAKLAGVAALAGVSALKPVFQAAKLLGGEEGFAVDFLARELLINDYSAILTWSGRPSEKLTITRSTTKWVVNRAGLLASVSANALAYDHDPATGAPLGVLVETAGTNLLLRSAEIDDAAWTKALATTIANAATAADGTTTMDKLVAASGTGEHTAAQTLTGTTNTNTYVASVWIAPGELTKATLEITEATTLTRTGQVTVDLTAGTVTSATVAGGATLVGSGCIRYATGGHRVWIAVTLGGTDTSIRCRLLLRDAAGASTFAGDGTSGLYAWGAQVEVGTYPSSHIPTTTAPVTRSADVVSLLTSQFPFSATRGGLIVEWSVPWPSSTSTSAVAADLTDGTTSKRIGLQVYSNYQTQAYVTDGTGQVSILLGDNPAPGAVRRAAMGWALNDTAVSLGGAAAVADTACTIPSGLTKILLGSRSSGTLQLNGHLRRVAAITRRPSNAELQSLSTVQA